jgi:hypothetical protein
MHAIHARALECADLLALDPYFNHFSLLASIEQLFGVQRLGYAASTGVTPFGASVWTNYSGG